MALQRCILHSQRPDGYTHHRGVPARVIPVAGGPISAQGRRGRGARGRGGVCSLVRVDDGGEVDLAGVDQGLQYGKNPGVSCEPVNRHEGGGWTWLASYSSGCAGSMMTASLVLSSVTR